MITYQLGLMAIAFLLILIVAGAVDGSSSRKTMALVFGICGLFLAWVAGSMQ